MKTKLWVGGVKSTSPVGVLEEAFGRFGKVSKAETGFPGFAFVEFEDGADAIDAQAKLDKTVLQSIGKIHVTPATYRGYEDACKKRDDYWRTKGGNAPMLHRSRSPVRKRSGSRSPPPRKRSGSSSSFSRASRRRSNSRRGSLTRSISNRRKLRKKAKRSTSRSRSRSRARSLSHQPKGQETPALENGHAAVDTPPAFQLAHNSQKVAQPEGVWLSDVDRAGILCFFDGTTAHDLLIEGASVSKAHNPERMPSFPRAFPEADGEIQAAMLTALGAFSSDATKESRVPEERSIEVRQTIIVSPEGLRLVRKTLVLDGTVCYSEDKTL